MEVCCLCVHSQYGVNIVCGWWIWTECIISNVLKLCWACFHSSICAINWFDGVDCDSVWKWMNRKYLYHFDKINKLFVWTCFLLCKYSEMQCLAHPNCKWFGVQLKHTSENVVCVWILATDCLFKMYYPLALLFRLKHWNAHIAPSIFTSFEWIGTVWIGVALTVMIIL